jgi:co-chaperonin GroES (HSP10)
MESINQQLAKRIQAIKVPLDLVKSNVNVIPLGKSVLLQRVKGGERKSETGLIIPDAVSTQEFTARIIALGPECSDYLKVGLLVIYNSMANLESIINGKPYLMTHESSIYYIVLDEEAQVKAAPESSEQKRRNAKIQTQAATLKRVDKAQANQEDAYEEKLKARKKTIFAVTKQSKKK